MFRLICLSMVLSLSAGCAWLTDYQYQPATVAPTKAAPVAQLESAAVVAVEDAPVAEPSINNDDVYLIEHEGRYYVFDDEAVYQSFMQNGETAYRLVRIGEGPAGSTLVFGLRDADKAKSEGIAAVDMYDGRLAGASEGFYAEVLYDERFYVFSDWNDLVNFQRTHIADLRYTEIGAGPAGRTVVYVLNDGNKADKPVALIERFKRIHAG